MTTEFNHAANIVKEVEHIKKEIKIVTSHAEKTRLIHKLEQLRFILENMEIILEKDEEIIKEDDNPILVIEDGKIHGVDASVTVKYYNCGYFVLRINEAKHDS